MTTHVSIRISTPPTAQDKDGIVVGNIAVTSHLEGVALRKRLENLPSFQNSGLRAQVHSCDVRENSDISDEELERFVSSLAGVQAEPA